MDTDQITTNNLLWGQKIITLDHQSNIVVVFISSKQDRKLNKCTHENVHIISTVHD